MTFPTTPILDDFNRPNEGPPPSASWSNSAWNGLRVLANTCVRSAAVGFSASFWNPQQFVNFEVYASIVGYSNPSVTASAEVIGRFDIAARNGYAVRISGRESSGTLLLGEYTAGVLSSLGSLSVPFPGDGTVIKVGLCVCGNNLEAWYKLGSGDWTLEIQRSNSLHTSSGNIGAGTSTASTGLQIEDFGGGAIQCPWVQRACGRMLRV